jgi:hypothetical protein
MANQSRMTACLGLTILTATLGNCGILSAQNNDRAANNDAIVKPATVDSASDASKDLPTVQQPDAFHWPDSTSELKVAGFTHASVTSQMTPGQPSFNTPLQEYTKRAAATRRLEKQLEILFPDCEIHLTAFLHRVVIEGRAQSNEESARVVQVVRSSLKKLSPRQQNWWARLCSGRRASSW